MLRLMFTPTELSLKFPNNLRMLSNTQNIKIPKLYEFELKLPLSLIPSNIVPTG